MPNDVERADELADFLCFSVYEAGHAFNQLYRELLAELGLTYPQYLVMTLLWRRDDRSVKDLGLKLGLASNTLTPLLKRLESNGLIGRRRDPADERSVRIVLTKAGRDLKARAKIVPERVAEATGLTQAELAELAETLRRLRSTLSERAPG
ncbi:MarR family winged helix-turn-helix transcriptional regulator [Jiella pacifica]|uniref:MarR family transcriptional regulator n=1 Tax=Jiella pacifica TaxID=2696469 RepID=A0A6N9T967_9HYPH|nr:MarR family transcriptional regulator [Jiella pacifica]NDW06239.1 MarR family transcriptional regulator [Jiella pacifica]